MPFDRYLKENGYQERAVSSGSEFMEVCAKADAVKMWSVLDEMAETVKLLNPRLYLATIDKLKG